MRRKIVTMQFFETYYYANVIHNILSEPFAYLRHLNDWHESSQEELFTATFNKWSVLHSLSAFIIESLLDEYISDTAADHIANNPHAELWIDRAMRYHGIAVHGFRGWLAAQGVAVADLDEDHIADYHASLQESGELETLVEQLVNEVFFVLFANRLLLARLNGYVAGIVSRMDKESLGPALQARLTKDGQLRRTRIPEWAKKAVFFRDRGMCTQCLADISGLLATQSEDNFDHIVPLKQGGMNDVTNLQLLCGACNRIKGGRGVASPNRYESWY